MSVEFALLHPAGRVEPLWHIRRRCRGWKDVDGVVRSGHPLDSDDRQGAPVKGDTT